MNAKRKLPTRFKLKRQGGDVHVGVAWYTEKEWAKVKAAAADPERFEETYAEWVQVADGGLATLRAAGIDADRCHIAAAELLAWCLAHGRPNDGAARAAFVSEQGRKSHEPRN
jgi:hypothetical protein